MLSACAIFSFLFGWLPTMKCIASALRSAFVASSTLKSQIHSSSSIVDNSCRKFASTSSTLQLHSIANNNSYQKHCQKFSSSAAALAMTASSDNDALGKQYPELLVFDMDACLWDKEMYEMSALPSQEVVGDLNGRGDGVIGVMSGRDKISLHRGSLIALQEHLDGEYPGMKIAMASSADTPFAEKVGRAALKMLEVVPGTTVWDVCMRDWDGRDINKIGRQPPLSSNKSKTHFPLMRKETGIRYDRMLFFDDCLWGDHCGMVEQNCKEEDSGMGPATVRTPNGLGEQEWRKGLKVYAEKFGSKV